MDDETSQKDYMENLEIILEGLIKERRHSAMPRDDGKVIPLAEEIQKISSLIDCVENTLKAEKRRGPSTSSPLRM